MNEIPRQPKIRPTTQAAEGVPRLRWTLAEFERLAELGIFTEEDSIELIGGSWFRCRQRAIGMRSFERALNWFIGACQKSSALIEIGWRPERTYAEPDL